MAGHSKMMPLAEAVLLLTKGYLEMGKGSVCHNACKRYCCIMARGYNIQPLC